MATARFTAGGPGITIRSTRASTQPTMYIDRALLLACVLAIVFLPAIERWVAAAPEYWFRPFIVWMLVIAAAWWNQRLHRLDDL
jgi:hypothetical protein